MRKIFVFILFAATSIVQAQLKIGNNTTTINNSNNLEIEATSSDKVYINKVDGRVFIENKQNASPNDSIVMSDAYGELRQISINRLMGFQDFDNDGLSDNEDSDDDGDGILDINDKCPLQYGCPSNPAGGLTHGCPVNCIKSNNMISSLNCSSARNVGLITLGAVVNGVFSKIPYTGGNGSQFSAITVPSTGVLGLTASISSGSFNLGSDSITVNISGTPSSSGIAYFNLTVGGQTCTLSRVVNKVSVLSIQNNSFENCSGVNLCPPNWSNCLTNSLGVDCNYWVSCSPPSSAKDGAVYIRAQQLKIESIAQSFNTTIGDTYNISCWIYKGTGGLFYMKQNGQTFSNTPGSNLNNWINIIGSFIATSSVTELRLEWDLTSASCDGGIDKVTSF